MSADAPTTDDLARVLDAIDADTPPALEVAERLADAIDTDVDTAQRVVWDAIDDGVLVEEGEGFGGVRLADDETTETAKSDEKATEEPGSRDETPTPETGETGVRESVSPASAEKWDAVDFSEVEPRTWAPAHIGVDAWMCRTDTKAPYAPWADADAPVECNHSDHDEPTTCGECDHHAGYKWGSEGSREHVHADHDTAREWSEKVPTLSSDLAFIQRDADPFAFVDGDDVRDPETGEVHPAFEAFLEHLGLTYADVSTSGSGVHAVYRGEIPLDGVPQAMFAIDTEPWGSNDDVPEVEIYDGKHVCIATGDHIAGTGTEVAAWDDDALAAVLRANGFEERPEPSADTSVDLEDHTPTATESGETTDDIRDIYAALDRLDARRVAGDMIVHEWNDAASTSGDNRAFVPTWGRSANGTANIVDREIWQDTGGSGYGGVDVIAAVACPDLPSYDERTQPGDLEGADWLRAVEYLRDAGYAIPELDRGDAGTEGDEQYRRDLLDLDVVVEPANALAAAAAVEPSDLGADAELPELERDDVDDVAIAVALAGGWIDSPSDFPSDGRYTEAYYRARDRYGAPLPKYLDNTTLEERGDLAVAAAQRVRPEHILDSDGLQSTVSDADPSGDAIARLDPSYEDSESGERILAYDTGFYCVEHGPEQPSGWRSFSPLQLVAAENGITDSEYETPKGGAYKDAYRLLREEYGAPLPKWRATVLEHVAVLPPSIRILDDEASAHAPSETLDEARERTEALIRDAVGVRGHAQLVTSLPGTGKTYGFTATSDDHPGVYLTRRNELKAQAEAYADEIREDEDHHPDAEPSVLHLPILTENTLPEEAVIAGVAAIREQGRELLRDGEALLDHVEPYLDDERDAADEDDDEVDLQRATCPTAEGEHGDAWRIRVLIARALDHTPAEIHRRDEALFGESTPCHHDSGECRYSRGWDRVRDPDNPADLLVGSPEHAHVDSATTHFSRDSAGDRVESARAAAIDEFPEEAYFSTYGERFMDHAVWLAEALTDVDSREDLLDAGLDTDTWVDLWLDGAGEEYGVVADAIEALAAAGDVAEASTAAAEILAEDRVEAVRDHTSANVSRLRAALATLADADPEDGGALGGVVDDLGVAADRIGADADAAYADGRDGYGELYALADDLEDLLQALTRGVDTVDTGEGGLLAAVEDRLDALPVGGDLCDLLDAAVAAVAGDAPDGVLDAATTALRGGRDGCRELALFASDGYAHPDAWALLAGAIADVDDDHVREVREATFSFDTEAEGGVFKRLEKNGATVVVDKNHHGALVVDPPAFTDAKGEKCPVLGLDATGRPELWRHAIGRDVQRRDIHDTDAQRRRFLREAVNLRVIQTSDTPLSYHSSPEGKNFQEDLALVEAVAEEYTGDADGAVDDKGPAVISTLKVVNHLEEELGAHAGEVVNYEGMKGSDALGEHQVAVILGSQHYSDVVPEKWALVAGEDAGRGDTHGAGLDYGSDVANAYLRHMREDHTMQGALRAGRNDEDTLVFAHTSALREDLPVVDEGAVVSAHSQGTLAVVEAAAEFRDGPFTAREVADAIADDDRAVGVRQVQNVLANLREGGYLQSLTDPHAGRAGEYELEEDPGLAEVDLPDLEAGEGDGENEIPGSNTLHTWNFAFDGDDSAARGGVPPSTPVIPAGDTAAAVSDGVEPPG